MNRLSDRKCATTLYGEPCFESAEYWVEGDLIAPQAACPAHALAWQNSRYFGAAWATTVSALVPSYRERLENGDCAE